MRSKPRPPPALPTPDRLKTAALTHLERFAATRSGLARFLERRVARYERATGEAVPDAPGWIAAIVADCVRLGYVDDRLLAEAKLAGLRGQGHSRRAIIAKLLAKGVSQADIAAVFKDAEQPAPGDAADPDADAAWVYARRRGLGPFRAADQRAAFRQRDLAALARRGFDAGTALAVIDADPDGPTLAISAEPGARTGGDPENP